MLILVVLTRESELTASSSPPNVMADFTLSKQCFPQWAPEGQSELHNDVMFVCLFNLVKCNRGKNWFIKPFQIVSYLTRKATGAKREPLPSMASHGIVSYERQGYFKICIVHTEHILAGGFRS